MLYRLNSDDNPKMMLFLVSFMFVDRTQRMQAKSSG